MLFHASQCCFYCQCVKCMKRERNEQGGKKGKFNFRIRKFSLTMIMLCRVLCVCLSEMGTCAYLNYSVFMIILTWRNFLRKFAFLTTMTAIMGQRHTAHSVVYNFINFYYWSMRNCYFTLMINEFYAWHCLRKLVESFFPFTSVLQNYFHFLARYVSFTHRVCATLIIAIFCFCLLQNDLRLRNIEWHIN